MASPVVPEPAKKSNTIAFLFVANSITFLIRSVGFGKEKAALVPNMFSISLAASSFDATSSHQVLAI